MVSLFLQSKRNGKDLKQHYSFFLSWLSFSAMKALISPAMESSFSHCSLYSVTGNLPSPYTDTAPFSLTLMVAGPRRFSAVFSALNLSSSALRS